MHINYTSNYTVHQGYPYSLQFLNLVYSHSIHIFCTWHNAIYRCSIHTFLMWHNTVYRRSITQIEYVAQCSLEMQYTLTPYSLTHVVYIRQINQRKVTEPPYPINDITFSKTLCIAIHLKSSLDLSPSKTECKSQTGREGKQMASNGPWVLLTGLG